MDTARRQHPAAWPPFSVSLHGALPKRHQATGSSPERDVRGPLQQREDRPASSAAICVGRAGGSWDPPSGEGVGQTTFTPPRGQGDRGSSQGTTRGYSVVKARVWPRQGSPGRGGLVLRPRPLSCGPGAQPALTVSTALAQLPGGLAENSEVPSVPGCKFSCPELRPVGGTWEGVPGRRAGSAGRRRSESCPRHSAASTSE